MLLSIYRFRATLSPTQSLARLNKASVPSNPSIRAGPQTFICRAFASKAPRPSGGDLRSNNLRPIQSAYGGTTQTSQQIQYRLNKQSLAQRMWREGRRDIYTAPSHTGLIIGAWMIAGTAYLVIDYYAKSGMLKIEEARARGLKDWVPMTYWVVCGAFGLLGSFFLTRSFYFVKSIRLVETPTADRSILQLAITQRSWIPFRTHTFTVEPQKIVLERRLAVFLENPMLAKTDVGNQATVAAGVGGVLKNMVLTPYLVMRKLLHDGVISARVKTATKPGKKEEDRLLRIDIDGKLSNDGKDLIELVSFRD